MMDSKVIRTERLVVGFIIRLMGSLPRRPLFILAPVIGFFLSSDLVFAQEYITRDGMADAEIVIDETPLRMVDIAAHELQTYLKKISGAELPVVHTPGEGTGVKIYVGRSRHTDSLGITDEGLRYGAYRMVSGQGYLVLLGRDFDYEPQGPVPLHPWPNSIPAAQKEWDQMTGSYWINPMNRTYKHYHRNFEFWLFDEGGSLNAVYAFLRMLGARWYMPGDLGEVIPEVASIHLPALDKTVKPDFPLRHIHWAAYRSATWDNLIWERRMGMNSGYEILGAGRTVHGMRDVLGRDEMQAAHPEYYALIDGKRDTVSRGYGHACFSSEGLVQETVEFARAVYDDFGMPSVSVWPLDGYKHCECESCRDKSPSDLVWRFVDKVAGEVYKTHPDHWITCGAYAQYRPPPGNVDQFGPNVAVFIANCGRPFLEDPQRWSSYWELIEGWQEKVVPGNIIRAENNLYTLKWGERGYVDPIGFPVIHPHAMAKDLEALKGISLGHWGEVSRINLGSGRQQIWKAPGLDHLNLYVQSRFLWDSEQNADSLLNEYYSLFYGPASQEMKGAFEYAEANLEYAENNFWCFIDGPWRRGYCDENMDLSVRNHLLELLHAARQAAGDSIYGARIQVVIDDLQPYDELLEEEKEYLALKVVDRSTLEPVEDAHIMLDQFLTITGRSGEAGIDLLEGSWDYTVEHEDYFPVTDSVRITGDTSMVISLARRMEVLVRVVDRATKEPVYRAVLEYGGTIKITDDSGTVLVDDPIDEGWVYTLKHNDYFTVADSVRITGDTSLVIPMTRKLADLHFVVRDSSGPLSGTAVTLNEWTIKTGSEGMAIFNSQPAKEKYGYSIGKSGYNAVSDSLFLEIDTTLTVFLEPATGLSTGRAGETLVFPNPAAKKLYIHTGVPEAEAMLLNPEGKVLTESRVTRGLNMLDVADLPSGLYFLRIWTGKEITYTKVILQH